MVVHLNSDRALLAVTLSSVLCVDCMEVLSII